MRPRRLWFDLHDASLTSPAAAILGLPFDGSASLKAGAAQGPARLRALSVTSDPVTRRGEDASVTVRDHGDVSAAAGGGPLAQREYLDAALARLEALPRDAFVIALGGDNSVSIPCLQAFARRHDPRRCGVIWFDAHPDLFETYDGNPDSHACALRRGMTLGGIPPGRAVLLGTRSFSRQEAAHARSQGIEVITAARWLAEGPDKVAEAAAARLSGLDAVYLAIDIDGFDSSCAPGTGYPMPGGVGAEEFFRLHELLMERLPVRAMDITEIAPPLDTNDITGFLGVQIVLETLGALRRRG